MSGVDQAAPVISRAGRGVRTLPDKQFPAGIKSSGGGAHRKIKKSCRYDSAVIPAGFFISAAGKPD